MASDALFMALAQALGQPSKTLRAVQSAGQAGEGILGGYREGQGWGDEMRKRALSQQTLSDALAGQPLEQGIMNLTGESGTVQHPNISALVALKNAEAMKNKMQRPSQLFGTRGNEGMVYIPGMGSEPGSVTTIPIPSGEGPILPRSITPTLSPYADPSGQPLAFTPGRGLSPTPSVGGTPVLKQGGEQAISDAAIMQAQIPNIDKVFDSYKTKGPIEARIQATPAGGIIDPVAKQAENSLKLAAFTFGGKQLTGQEKQVVFGAFFPSPLDNAQSLENKRDLLKNYFAGKIDLLQAANLLGPAGVPLRGMLQAKQQTAASGIPSFNTPEEAEASGYKGPATIGGRRAVIH